MVTTLAIGPGDAGLWNSVTIGDDGLPVIAYEANDSLYVAQCDDTAWVLMEFENGEMTNSNGWTLEWGSAYIQVRDENGDFVAGWDPGKMNYIALAED